MKKIYQSPQHEEHRFAIFKENMEKAAELNKLNPEAHFGVNQFSDLHSIEFTKKYLNYVPAVGDAALLRQQARKPHRATKAPHALPANFDWRAPDQGRAMAVTPVKDQGQCGSCWAFSATEAIESQWILAGNPMATLSPQQIVDCDTSGSDQGCNGGDTVTAYAYVETVGLEGDGTYPYTSGASGQAGTCQFNASAVIAKISAFTYATPGCTDTCPSQNEATLQQSLYTSGPVSICVDASVWQTYVSGILTPASGCQSAYTALDHCVELTGWGIDAATSTQFWSVRNSWATSWGEAGYIRLSYGTNTCGVADEATIPTIG